jgi:glutathione S-transferase
MATMTFYYCPGACSMATHVALEEIGVTYEKKPILIAKNEQRDRAFLAVNPHGQVPALVVDGKLITETAATLAYLGRAFPEAKLLPRDEIGRAQCLSTMCWIASQIDPLFRRAARPERFVSDEAARPTVKQSAEAAYWAKCQEIDALLNGREWIAGSEYTVCDPYALVYYGWGFRFGFAMKELRAYTDLKDRLLQRPAVRKTLEDERHPLIA